MMENMIFGVAFAELVWNCSGSIEFCLFFIYIFGSVFVKM